MYCLFEKLFLHLYCCFTVATISYRIKFTCFDINPSKVSLGKVQKSRPSRVTVFFIVVKIIAKKYFSVIFIFAVKFCQYE